MKKYCHQPYDYCEIDNKGEVFVCCNKWCKYYSFGNILEQSFDEIWNGERAQNFRKQFIEQNFEHCRLDICPLIVDEDRDCTLKAEFPQVIRLNFDETCNVECVFCRNYHVKPNENAEKMYEFILNLLPEINENNGVISLNGVGEVFCSKLSLNLIKKCISDYPNIKFAIITNGVLCSKEMIERLGLQDKIHKIEISVHATKEETYNKLIKGGNFKRLKENLKYISTLVKAGKITKFGMNFVVTTENYKEMPDFIRWAKKLGAMVQFLPLLPAYDEQVFKNLNILDKENQKLEDFIKIIKKPIFKDEDVLISQEYTELAKEVPDKTLLEKILSVFK